MANLVVQTTDERSFLDRVVDHGVDHGLLTQTRLETQAASCDTIHSNLCTAVGLNEWEPDETLAAAEIVQRFLNLILEKESCGNVAVAISVLNDQLAGSLVIALLNQLSSRLDRFMAIAQKAPSAEVKYGYTIILSKFVEHSSNRGLSITPGVDDSQIFGVTLSKQGRLLAACKAIQTYIDFQNWLTEIADIELQYLVSSRYLPWGALAKETDLQLLKDDEQDAFIDLGIFIWSPDTLIATMVINLLCGRGLQTVFPYQLVPKLARWLRKPEVFIPKARREFSEFLTQLPLKPKPKEEACLWELFDSAMDDLLADPPTATDLERWYHLIHIEAPLRVLFRAVEKSDLTETTTKHPAENLLELIESGKSRGQIVAHLKKIDWSKMLSQGYADTLIQRLEANLVLRHVPLTPELVIRICAFWSTQFGQQAWSPNQRRALVQKVLPRPFKAFWRFLPSETTAALAEACPEMSKQILSKIA